MAKKTPKRALKGAAKKAVRPAHGKKAAPRKSMTKSPAHMGAQPKVLSGGNPQIPKG